ncbi:MAG: hypothetical protein H0T80_11370 [Betaproteobacteria bacterium]|nr:hypothetical protein [Betaproteobacteria bacterium]
MQKLSMRLPRPSASERARPDTVNPSAPYRALIPIGYLLLCAAWVVLGLAGHDPWKTEDAVSIGAAFEMAQRGDYLVPTNAAEPELVRPPLIYAAAALAINAFAPPLKAHNAARLFAGVMLALTLLLAALASRELTGRSLIWLPVLLLVGSVGFWDRAHTLAPELGLMLGVASGLYGFALALRRPIAGGLALGLGVAFAFGSYGLLGPLWLALSALALPACGVPWRTRSYCVTLLLALVVALPLCALWPWALHARDAALFATWWEGETFARYVAPARSADSFDPWYFPKNLLWFAWPSLPLVVWMLWTRGRGFNGGLSQPAVVIPGVVALVILTSLVLLPDGRLVQAMPLLVPLALLGAIEVDSLERGLSSALNWFGILMFGLLAIVFWGLWIDSYIFGMSLNIARIFRDSEIGFQPSFHLGTMLAAVLLTVFWIVLVRPAHRSNRRAILNWAAGITLVWGLYATIWLPYLDLRRSYRVMIDSVAHALPTSGCVASRNLGEAQRALFYYLAGLRTVREEVRAGHDCSALLVQYGWQEVDAETPEGHRKIWEGKRRGDETERFVLYRRIAS